MDGGFRTGADVFKALALGADCCWVGRPAIWGLAVSVIFSLWQLSRWVSDCSNADTSAIAQYNGQAGVERMLEIMHDEFRRCMQLTGCRTVKDITTASLARIDADGVPRRMARL